jgi:hypothetical protein
MKMPFGLCGAAQTFQRYIHQVLADLDFCFAYIDDVLISSNSEEEHQEHLQAVLKRFQEHGMKINGEKSVFGVTEIEFLGFSITKDGMKPLSDRVKAVLEYKKPKTINELRKFLGIINFYRRHIPHAALTQAPLNSLHPSNKKGKNVNINWTEELDTAF